MKKSSLPQAVACGLLGSALLCGPTRVSAQQFGAPGTDYLPDGSLPAPIGVVDLDGDGDLDLIDSAPALWRNDGSGHFAAPSEFNGHFRGLRFVSDDLDGNGETDLVWYGPHTSPWLMRQFGGQFNTTTYMPLFYARQIEIGDLDGDGDRDLLLLCDVAQLTGVHLLGGGGRLDQDLSAGFPASTSSLDNPLDARLADLDGDGDLDILALQSDRLELFTNDGQGNFTERQELALRADQIGSLHCADFDGDGDVDARVVSGLSLITGFDNDGSGRLRPFGTAAPTRNRSALDVDVTDIDADGDFDLVIAQDQLIAYLNDGTGRTPTTRVVVDDWQREQRALFADYDGDGRTDLLVDRGPRLYLQGNDGRMVRTDSVAIPRSVRFTNAYLSGDFDGDGHIDLLSTGGSGGALLLGDGRQSFRDATANLPGAPHNHLSAAVADLDADGDLDVVLGSLHSPCRVLLNDGSARFATITTTFTQTPDTVHVMAVGDLDGDGRPELVTASALAGLRVWRNQLPGDIIPSPGALPGPVPGPQGIELADLDGDGDLDLLLGFPGSSHPTTPGHVRRFTNDGTGTFREVPGMPNTGMGPIDTFDLEGDGDLDIIAGDQVFENDGRGSFAALPAARLPQLPMSAEPVHVLDVDADGHPDLITSADGGHALHNRGDGSFVDMSASWMPGGMAGHRLLGSADVDADGDHDLLLSGIWGDELWLSRSRDLQARSLATTGGDLRYELAAHGRTAQLAWVWFATGTDRRVAVPGLGVLRLDLSALLAQVSLPLTDPDSTELRATLPADPSLVGLRIDAQALIGNTTDGFRLSNAASTTVLR